MTEELVPVQIGEIVPSQPKDRNAAYVYLSRLAPSGQRSMRDALHTIAGLLSNGQHTAFTFPWHGLRYQHTQAVRATLSQRYSPATTNKHLSVLRGVLKEAWRLGQMGAEDYQRAVDLPSVRGTTLPKGRALSSGELRALFVACANDQGPAGPRDAALIGVLYGAGLRRSEAVSLDLADYNPETGQLTIRAGKGHKARAVFATNGTAEALADWLAIRGDGPGPLFLPVSRGHRLQARRMTDQAVLYILQQRAKQAGVPAFSPHDLRRSFISDLLDAGADIATVQQMAGHANVTTTARYDRRGEQTKKRAAELLHIPYVRARL